MRTYIRNLISALSNIMQQGCHEMKDCYGNERIDSRCFFIIILFSYYQNSHSKKNSKSKKQKRGPFSNTDGTVAYLVSTNMARCEANSLSVLKP